ncbi:hypothetical protein AND_003716 [Anopheles darlingi]|uniref:Uncharacterized protein n=1 Tax=Anopheles darlingi TaxID=43151 RepID=W5JJI2_ANODA|nr:hypothetical protein AND_003716 [Anopheles darlingi]
MADVLIHWILFRNSRMRISFAAAAAATPRQRAGEPQQHQTSSELEASAGDSAPLVSQSIIVVAIVAAATENRATERVSGSSARWW